MSLTADGRPHNGAAPVAYPVVPSQPRYPAIEEEILAYWRDDRTFEASVEAHQPDTEFVFYDGPPLPTGCLTTDTS